MPERSPVHQLIHHSWRVSLPRAAEFQARLAELVQLVPLVPTPRLVAGVDTAQHHDMIYVAAVVMDWLTGKVVEIQYKTGTAQFPYFPGYRAFREGPTIQKAVERLRCVPELLFVAGHGVCHPRLCGIASHIGLRLDLPTIGCARERLVGRYDPPRESRGKYSVIRYSPQAPGVVLRTREGTKPVFVSPGHRIDLLGAIEQTMRCCLQYRIPEPLRRAHIEAGRYLRMRTRPSV